MADRGSFHLGHVIDVATGKSGAEEVVVGSSDLTTHGVIVGMTGSGKTGLAVVLIEEALLTGIPVLCIDPKGDLGNLALTFPDLAPASFEPWVDPAQAQSEGVTSAELAEKTATTWREGLAAQGMGATQIQALRSAADVTIYTPGSAAGLPLNVIGSLRAPTLSWETEAETLRDEIEGMVTSLLALVGIAGDPLASREHVLLSNLIETAWRAGQDLELETLIGQIQSPPLRKLGVFEIDQFFPQNDRTALALRFNALVASPSFAAWGEGEPLDPQSLLFTADGKPRCAIVYTAHLSDEERMFVTTLVFAKLVTWMRSQSGTSDLRALAYMDEVAGYLPPTAAPPAKKPILTILKQGRAFGLGLVLSTQNPVDLDYKAMSNAGLWLVGRLQTENDKARVLEALKSAAGSVDIAALDVAIGGLEKRQFMLVSAKDAQPRVFGTRWAMSFLRGPLTRDQVQTLMAQRRVASSAGAAAPPPMSSAADANPMVAATAAAAAPLADDETTVPPIVTQGVSVTYLDPATPWGVDVGLQPTSTRLRAFIAARIALRYDDATASLDEQQEYEGVWGPLDRGLDLEGGRQVDFDDRDFRAEAPTDATYILPSAKLDTQAFWSQAARDIQQRLVDNRPLELYRNRELKLTSRPGETRAAFLARCDVAAQEKADAETAKIRDRLEAKRDKLAGTLAIARQRVEEVAVQTKAKQANDLIAGAGAVLGALLGGRRDTRSITRAVGRAASSAGSVATGTERRQTAEARAHKVEDELVLLEQQILDEVTEIDARWKSVGENAETVSVRLEATDVRVSSARLVWVPSA
jgi:hypothetical protein